LSDEHLFVGPESIIRQWVSIVDTRLIYAPRRRLMMLLPDGPTCYPAGTRREVPFRARQLVLRRSWCIGTWQELLFVKVHSDEGIHGWGECYTSPNRDQSVEWTSHQMGGIWWPRSFTSTLHLRDVHDFLGKRGSTETFCAISASSTPSGTSPAKLRPAGLQPARRRCREKVRVYANGWGDGGKTPPDAARALEILRWASPP